MAYQERGSGPPHFDGKNYQMWSKRMVAFLRENGQILWDVTVDIGYVQPMSFLAPGSRDMFDANNKAADYLFRALCQPEFDRVHTENLACRIWSVSYGPPWAHYLGGYQDRLLGGPLGLSGLRYTAPDGVEHKDYRGEVLG
jgi:hypothetical protein